MRFSPRDLLGLRSALQLPHQVAVTRVTLGYDSAGYETETTTTTALLPCALTPKGGEGQQVIAGREQLVSAYTVMLQHDADIEPDDRLDIDGETYYIVRLYEQHTPHLCKIADVVVEGDIEA